MASRSVEQPHVRFASKLTVPPADRQRKGHSFYPKVAQEKGRSQRRSSFDLFWRWDRLSSVPLGQNERKPHQATRVAVEADLEERDCATLFNDCGGTPLQHTQQTRRRWIFTGFGFDAASWTTCKRPWLPLHAVLECSRTFLQTVSLGMVNSSPSIPRIAYVDKRPMVY
jgi:hypothetical protein